MKNYELRRYFFVYIVQRLNLLLHRRNESMQRKAVVRTYKAVITLNGANANQSPAKALTT